MSIWCAIPIIVSLVVFYFTLYALCRVAGDADDRMAEYQEYLKGEIK